MSVTMVNATSLRSEADRLEALAAKLREAALLVDCEVIIPTPAPPRTTQKAEKNGTAPHTSGNGAPKRTRKAAGGKTRKESLADLIQSRGGMTRKQILEVSGIPAGTLGALLKEPDFVKGEGGVWVVAEESHAQEQA